MAGEQLRVTEGKERGTRLSVDADLLIGRVAPEDEGRLGDDPEISRRHAYVSRGADGQLTIEDLGSANGTFVNDERIDAPRTLEPRRRRQGRQDGPAGDRPLRRASPRRRRRPRRERPRRGGRPQRAARGAVRCSWSPPGTALGRRLTLGDELVIGRGGERRGEAERRLPSCPAGTPASPARRAAS